MRPALRLLATPATMGSKSSLSESLALLPPLQLYRRILRVHRKKLEPEMRILGDGYVKSEFRAHKDVDNPLHIVHPLLYFLAALVDFKRSGVDVKLRALMNRRSASLPSGSCTRRSWREIPGRARSWTRRSWIR